MKRFFIGRYLTNSDGRFLTKSLLKAEDALLAQHGIKIVSIFQEETYNPNTYNETRGYNDAVKAIAAATNVKQPSGTPIYFATEIRLDDPGYDPEDITAGIQDYLQGVVSVLSNATSNPKNYKLGVYGPQNTCKFIKEQLYPNAYTMYGNPIGNSYNGWTIHQEPDPVSYSGTLVGLVDFDTASSSSYGGWLYHSYPSTWSNYGNAANHRKKCLYCNKYIYQPHTPDSTGNRCTVCGYEGPILLSTDNLEEEQDE